jgi:hypothetical protein
LKELVNCTSSRRANCLLLKKKEIVNHTQIGHKNKELGDSTAEAYRNWFIENNFKERFGGELDKSPNHFQIQC